MAATYGGNTTDIQEQTTQETTTSEGTPIYQTSIPLELKILFESREEQQINSVIQNIIDITERTVPGQTADSFEFYYANGKPVQKGTSYHIHYTNDLNVYFMTGIEHNKNSELIYPRDVKKDTMGYYNSLNQQTPLIRTGATPVPTEDDYGVGSYTRYFAKKASDNSSPVFEVTQDVFESSPLYNFVSLTWYISGTRGQVFRANTLETIKASKIIPSVRRLLSPFQFYRYDANLSTVDALKRKLGDIDLSGYNTTTLSDGSSTTSGALDGIDGQYGEGSSGVNDVQYDADGNIIDEDKVCTDA